MDLRVASVVFALAIAGTSAVVQGQDRVVRYEASEIYAHQNVRMRTMGEGAKSYWMFLPEEPMPRERAPVIVFVHGWMGVNPAVYGAWIEHLVRRGGIVVFPRYQNDVGTPASDFLKNATIAVRDALDVLETGNDLPRPDLQRFALIGHSAGGNLAAQLAASARDYDLPAPKAVIAVMPGEVTHTDDPRLSQIPADTLLVTIVGEDDIVVGDHRAREIYEQATAVPVERKEYVFYRTDRRGPRPLVADHLAPTGAEPRFDSGDGVLRAIQIATAQVDILDRHGFWRVGDVTLRAAFSGQTLDDVSEGGAVFRDLGRWGDDRPVTPPLSGDDLAAMPRVTLPHGARLMPAPRDEAATGKP